MQEESKNVSPIVRGETLGVFSPFTSHSLLPGGWREGVRGAVKYSDLSFFCCRFIRRNNMQQLISNYRTCFCFAASLPSCSAS